MSLLDHGENVAEHYNSMEDAGIRERKKSGILHLRNFNNWIKATLIGEYSSKVARMIDEKHSERVRLNILDMCSGKGGDIRKWSKANVKSVVFVDIASSSVTHCKRRYEEMNSDNNTFKASFFVADCSSVRLSPIYKNVVSCRFDLVSCQFSIHYSFESIAKAEMMLFNASENLRIGGFLIGTTTNAYRIMHRLRQCDGHFQNNVCSIQMVDSSHLQNPPLFGCKYSFHLDSVVNVPEFLLYFPVFEKLAAKYGLRCVLKEPFDKYFGRKVQDPDCKELLRKMRALESYPPNSGRGMLNKEDGQYVRVEKAWKEVGNGNFIFGTLSLAEWEAITIYMVFAFQKVADRSIEIGDSSVSSNSQRESLSSNQVCRKRKIDGDATDDNYKSSRHEED